MIWNIVLSVVAAVLLFFQFGPKKNKTTAVRSSTSDTTNKGQFRMAYFEMDSVEANFNLVKDVKADIGARDIEYNNNLAKLDDVYKKRFNELSSKQSTMSQEQIENAQNELRDLGEKLKGEKQTLDQQYQDFVMRKNLEVKKDIEVYLKEYNKNHNYSYIISYEQGLFYFKDTAYDITTDVIRGLNDFYKNKK